MDKLDVVLFFESGWLTAIILKWNWMFHHGTSTSECDVWGAGDATREEFKANITETLKEQGCTPNFIEYVE